MQQEYIAEKNKQFFLKKLWQEAYDKLNKDI